MDLHDCDERGVEIVAFGLLRVQDFYRVGTAGDGEDGTLEEVFRELFSIERSGSDDNLQVRSSFGGFWGVINIDKNDVLLFTYSSTTQIVRLSQSFARAPRPELRPNKPSCPGR